MNKEDYVSYEVAKLLKEKGYTHYEKQHYFTEDIHVGDGITVKGRSLTEMFRLCDDFDEFKVYAPSLWDAAKWLRNKHNIFVDIESVCHDGLVFIFNIITMDDGNIGYDARETYEEALNEGIKEALQLI